MKKEFELTEFLINDYIYIPYKNKEDLNIKSDLIVFKEELICNNIYSPVSGKIYGLSTINSINGMQNVLIIENDFKDLIHNIKSNIKNIYKLKKEEVKAISSVMGNDVVLNINGNTKNDVRDSYILKDHIKEILEALNVMSLSANIATKILLDKKDILSYQTLFSYLGTYPNIEVVFNRSNLKDYKELNIYETIDIYNKLNNNNVRDYLYITLIYKDKNYVIKTKKYSNLIEIVSYLGINYKKISVNNKVIDDINFLLTEEVSIINVV